MGSNNAVLNAEMASINMASSPLLAEIQTNTTELMEDLSNIKSVTERVEAIKAVLESKEPYEVTVKLATEIDEELNAVGVTVSGTDVAGVEALGRTLTPQVYLQTRIAGCESLLSDLVKAGKTILLEFGASIANSYALITKSVDSVKESLEALDTAMRAKGSLDNRGEPIDISYRQFSLFQVNGVLKEDWINQLQRVDKTTRALCDSYYKTVLDTNNAVFSFFSGFDKLKSEEEVLERLKALPKTVDTGGFRLCTFPNKENSTLTAKAFTSPEMMGGRYFINLRPNTPYVVKNMADAKDFISFYKKNCVTRFGSNPNLKDRREDKVSVKALRMAEINTLLSLMRNILLGVTKTFTRGEMSEIDDGDFLSIVNSLGRLEGVLGPMMVFDLCNLYDYITYAQQKEALDIRVQVTNYVILLLTNLIEVCHKSLDKVNPDE